MSNCQNPQEKVSHPHLQMRKARLGTSTHTEERADPGVCKPQPLATPYVVGEMWVVFTFFTSHETSKEEEYLVMRESCKKFEFQRPSVEFCWMWPCPHGYGQAGGFCTTVPGWSRQKPRGPQHLKHSPSVLGPPTCACRRRVSFTSYLPRLAGAQSAAAKSNFCHRS